MVYSGAFSPLQGVNVGIQFNRQMQNLYLLARSHHLVELKTGVDPSVQGDTKEFIQFGHQADGQSPAELETMSDIYGSDRAADVDTALANTQRRAVQTMQQLQALVKDPNNKLDLFDYFIENS